MRYDTYTISKLIYRVWKNHLNRGLILAMLAVATPVWAVEIENPISANTFPELIQHLSLALVQIVIPLAVVALVFAGFKFIIASLSGDTKKLQDARQMLLWIIIGTAVVVGAATLADIAVNFAKNL